jgi:HSP20 family protein
MSKRPVRRSKPQTTRRSTSARDAASSRAADAQDTDHRAPGAAFGFSFGSRATGDSANGTPRATGVEGLLSGLSGLLKTIGDLAEKGQQFQREGGLTDDKGRDVRFHYGFAVRTLNDGRDVQVEPFGNLQRDQQTGETVVHELREPLTDVFEESDHVKVILEMPGVQVADIKTTLDGDILSVSAERDTKRYHKEILLPGGGVFNHARTTTTCNSGVVEICCRR